MNLILPFLLPLSLMASLDTAWAETRANPPRPVRVIEVYPSARPGERIHSNVSIIRNETGSPGAAPNPSALAPSAPGNAVAEVTGVDGAAAAAEEVERARAAQQEAYGGMNATNPMSESFDPAAQGLPTGVTPEMAEQLAKVQALLQNPWVQRYLRAFADPELMHSLDRLVKSGALKKLAIVQAVFLIFWMFFRASVLAKARKTQQRIVRSLVLGAVYFILAAGVIPLFMLGSIYPKLMQALARVFTG